MTDSIETGAPQPSQAPAPKKYVSRRGRGLVIAIIIILLLSLIGISALLLSYIFPRGGVATKDETNGITWVRSIYGWGRTPETQFVSPRRVNIADNGNILVTDPSQKNVMSFNPNGTLSRTYMSEATTPSPFGYVAVAMGPEQSIFGAEPEMDRVHVVSSTDQNLGSFVVPQPQAIAYRDGKMVIGSKSGFAILDPNTGKVIRLVGNFGHGPDQFDTVTGVAIDKNGVIYVTDGYNNRISAYRQDGRRLWMVTTGAPGNKVDVTGAAAVAKSTVSTAPAGLVVPSDITVDGNGRLVVVDGFDMSISVFDSKNGAFVAKYGAQGSKDGQFLYPSSIAYDAQHDWFAVADNGNARVQIIRLSGSGAASPVAAARRSMAGPLRACLFPFILLLIAIVAFVVMRMRRKRRDAAAGELSGENAEAAPQSA